MESYIFQVEISTKATLFLIKERDTDKCSGLMVHFTREIGKMEFKMEKARFI